MQSIGPAELVIVLIFIVVAFIIVRVVGSLIDIDLPPLTKVAGTVATALGAAASLLAILDALNVK